MPNAIQPHSVLVSLWSCDAAAAPAAAAAELERAVTQLGFRGALLYGRTGTAPADAPPFDALYAAAARLGARARLIMPLRAHCAPGKRAG